MEKSKTIKENKKDVERMRRLEVRIEKAKENCRVERDKLNDKKLKGGRI